MTAPKGAVPAGAAKHTEEEIAAANAYLESAPGGRAAAVAWLAAGEDDVTTTAPTPPPADGACLCGPEVQRFQLGAEADCPVHGFPRCKEHGQRQCDKHTDPTTTVPTPNPADEGDGLAEVIAAIKWRLDHYGPLDAKPFQYSRFESPAHAALNGAIAAGYRSPAEVERLLTEARAEAWDECAQRAWERGFLHQSYDRNQVQSLNPYRADSIAATEGEHTLGSGPADGGVG